MASSVIIGTTHVYKKHRRPGRRQDRVRGKQLREEDSRGWILGPGRQSSANAGDLHLHLRLVWLRDERVQVGSGRGVLPAGEPRLRPAHFLRERVLLTPADVGARWVASVRLATQRRPAMRVTTSRTTRFGAFPVRSPGHRGEGRSPGKSLAAAQPERHWPSMLGHVKRWVRICLLAVGPWVAACVLSAIELADLPRLGRRPAEPERSLPHPQS